MSQQLDLHVKAKAEFEAAFKKLQDELVKTKDKTRETGSHFDSMTSTSGKLADSIGRTATTMARSAESFGLPVGPLRALDDVMDVAELGFNGLTKSAAGFNAASFGVAGAGLAIGTSIGTALRNLTPLGAMLDKLADKWTGLTAVESQARKASGEAYAKLKAGQQELLHASEATIASKLKEVGATSTLEKASKLLGFEVKNVADAERVLAIAEANSTAGRKRATEENKKAAEEIHKGIKRAILEWTEGNETLAASLKELSSVGMSLPDLALKLPEPGALGSIKDATQATYENMLKMAEGAAKAGLGAEQIRLKLDGAGLSAEEVETIIGHLPPLLDHASKKTFDWQTALEGVAILADMVGGELGDLVGVLGNIGDSFARINEMEDGAAKSAAKLQAGISAVGQIGASLANSATPAVAKLGGALQGAAAGAKLGSAFGPWGIAIGAAAGAVFGFINKAKKLREELKKIKEGFAESMGGMDALKLKATQAGVSLDAMFRAKSKDQLLKAIDEVKDKLGTWGQAQQDLQAAIEKYGFTIEELGPKFAQQELDKQAAQLMKEFQLLSAAGVDVNTLIAKMGPGMVEFVNTSIAAGASIPEAMRPMVEALIASGQLLDANGEAFGSAEEAGITFAKSLTDSMADVIKSIEDLVAALTGVPNITRTVTTRHEDKYGPQENEEPAMARGGIVLPFVPRAANGIVSAQPGGRHVLVGEGGQAELVAPVAALADRIGRAAAAAAGGGKGGGNVYLDGQLVGKWLERRSRAGLLAIS